jgi:hypothetical protein
VRFGDVLRGVVTTLKYLPRVVPGQGGRKGCSPTTVKKLININDIEFKNGGGL